MKKLLFLLTFGLMTIIGNAQDSTKLAIPDTSQITYTRVYNDVKEGLTALGESLKVGSSHVYEVLVKQQLINSLSWITVLIFGIILVLLSYKFYKIEDWTDASLIGVLSIVSGLMSIIFIAGFFFNINTVLTGFLNPEYGAIVTILETIK